MRGFTGFRREHFDYFLLHDDKDSRRWVREQVEEISSQVLKQLRALDTFYDAYEVGIFKQSDAYCWVAFGPKDQDYRQKTHQTISFEADGLHVFVNTELKAATDRVKAITAQSGDRFRRTLLDLHRYEPFWLELDEQWSTC